MLTLRRLQSQMKRWQGHNFPDRPSYQPLLGAVEELGELAHAHIKSEQGIRTGEDHESAKMDAVADVVIFLADYCNAEGIDFQDALDCTWEMVSKRDWQAYPENGLTA